MRAALRVLRKVCRCVRYWVPPEASPVLVTGVNIPSHYRTSPRDVIRVRAGRLRSVTMTLAFAGWCACGGVCPLALLGYPFTRPLHLSGLMHVAAGRYACVLRPLALLGYPFTRPLHLSGLAEALGTYNCVSWLPNP